MFKPKKLITRFSLMDKDRYELTIAMNNIYMMFPGKYIDIDYTSRKKCSCGDYCYCPSPEFTVNVYDEDAATIHKENLGRIKTDGKYCNEHCPFKKKCEYGDSRECEFFSGFEYSYLSIDYMDKKGKVFKYKRCSLCKTIIGDNIDDYKKNNLLLG